MFDTEDNENSIKPTILDKIRIESLEIGEDCSAESDNFKVFRYPKEWSLVLLSKPKRPLLSFRNSGDLLNFLEKTT